MQLIRGLLVMGIAKWIKAALCVSKKIYQKTFKRNHYQRVAGLNWIIGVQYYCNYALFTNIFFSAAYRKQQFSVIIEDLVVIFKLTLRPL